MLALTAGLEGKTAIITGASSGLGECLALNLAAHKMNLCLAARRSEPLEKIASQAEAFGAEVLVQPTDVTQASQCKSLIEATVARFGRVDYLILNAGVSMWARLDEITDISIFQTLMSINYFGAINCIYPSLVHLKKSCGMIVAVSSLQAILGVPSHTGYAASKHALKGFLDALELELGGEIHILNAMPSWIRGTSLRANALTGGAPHGTSKRQYGRWSVNLSACSAQIVRAMATRQREIFIPAKLGALPWLKLLAPNWLKRRICRAVARQQGLNG